jgi:hypothetical protein
MTAADPEGRVRHLLDVMHKTFDDAGDPIAAGMVPVADGLGQVDYVDSSTFGATPLYVAHGNTGSTETFDTTGVPDSWHSATLNAATVTFTFTGAISGEPAAMVLELTQDGTGGRLVTWPGSVVWPGGTAPTLSTAGGATDILLMETRDGGTTWYGFPTGSAGSALTIKDEGSTLDTAVTSIDFVGGGVTATNVSHAVTVTIPTQTPDTTTYGIHAHIVSETHLSDGATTTYTLDNAIEPGTVIGWNTTTLARLGVTEVQPDQATVSAAGSSGDSIVFDYATPITV